MGNAHCTCSNDNDIPIKVEDDFPSAQSNRHTYLGEKKEKKLMQNSWNRTWVTSKRTRFVGYLNCELNAELLDGCHHRQLSRIKHTHVHIYACSFVSHEILDSMNEDANGFTKPAIIEQWKQISPNENSLFHSINSYLNTSLHCQI